MDRDKANKFLSLEDRLKLERISATHDNAVSFPSSIAEDEMTFDGSNAKTRHDHRGKLLGVIDRLLGTTAYYHGAYHQAEQLSEAHKEAYEKAAAELNAANATISRQVNEVAGLNATVKDLVASRDAFKKAYGQELEAHSKTRQKLAGYEEFGTVGPWFGGPYAALDIKPSETSRVFGKHNGVSWSFAALSERVNMLEAKDAEKLQEIKRLEKQNGELATLADKPMQILDDYYTVTDPFDKNASITIKQLVQRNLRQKDMLDENDERIAALRGLNTDQINTINRKDAKILEQAKEIKQLKEQASFGRFIKDGFVIADLAGKLRQTQEDLGDMTVAHNKACETIDMLNSRLDKINDMALDISDVADGTTEPEFEEEDFGVDPAYFADTAPGWDEVWTLDLETGKITKKG